MKKLILASQSPYRRSLLSRLFCGCSLPFEAQSPDIDEDKVKTNENFSCQDVAEELSFQKAQKIFETNSDAVVIGSDQVLEFEGQAFGKPHTVENAVAQISSMRNKWHKLITSVTVLSDGYRKTFSVVTKLKIRNLTDDEVKEYVVKDKPLDCAGSYKIESLGITLFDEIKCADFTAIEGLPLMELAKCLRELGYELP